MLHAQNQNRLYLIAPSDEQQALIDGLGINVQDRGWLVYCALAGYQHDDLPDIDTHSGLSFLDLYTQAA